MRFMGSKNRIAKHIIPILTKHRKEGQCYVEPFVGGANMIDKMDGWRIGADSHEYLMSFWKAFVLGWMPPDKFTEEQYNYVKNNKDEDKVLTGYVGFTLSFAGKWFGGWSRDKQNSDYADRAYRHMMKQRPNVVGVQFVHSSYDELYIPENSLIYCDPPYVGTTKYRDNFDHDKFWDWVANKSCDGHTVFVSEYNAPDFANCVWEKSVSVNFSLQANGKRNDEKLFKIDSNKARDYLLNKDRHMNEQNTGTGTSKETEMIAVWANRHPMTVEQEQSLRNNGVTTILSFDEPPKWNSGKDAWEQITSLNNDNEPDIVVGVIPLAMLPEYLRYSGNSILLRADMEAVTRGEDGSEPQYVFKGKWTHTVSVQIETKQWGN